MPKRANPGHTDPDQMRSLFVAGARVREIVRVTGLSHATVAYWRKRLGFEAVPRDRGHRARLAELHAAGKVDAEIAEALGCGRTNVRQMRNKMGLKAHGKGERFSALHREHYRRRVAAAGVKSIRSLANVRAGIGLAARAFARRFGLPEDLRKLQVRIVVALASGPLTANALADHLGRSQYRYVRHGRGYHRFNHALLPSGNYLTDLVHRGLAARTPVAGSEPLWALTPAALDLLASKAGAA